jgi:hypothetical protein
MIEDLFAVICGPPTSITRGLRRLFKFLLVKGSSDSTRFVLIVIFN